MVNLVLFAQIADHAGKQLRLPVLIPEHLSPAPQPCPLPSHVPGPVLYVVILFSSVCYTLIALQKIGLIMGMNQLPPKCGCLPDHLARQAEFLHHGLGITKYPGLHISHKDIVVRAGRQRFIEASAVIIKGGIPVLMFLPKPALGTLYVISSLLYIHLLVCPGYDVLHRAHIPRTDLCDSIAEGDVIFLELAFPFLSCPGQETLHAFVCRFHVPPIKYHDELITAETVHEVQPSKALLGYGCHVLKKPVPLAVSIPVIDRFQLVDIIQYHGHHLVLTAPLLQGPHKAFTASPAV